MARRKAPSPMRRAPSSEARQGDKLANGTTAHGLNGVIRDMEHKVEHAVEKTAQLHARESLKGEEKKGGIGALVICAAGIYGSFLSWAFLQERITTTTYGPQNSRFTYAIFLNTIQSAFAALTGYMYLLASAPRDSTGTKRIPAIFPSKAILAPLLLIAVTSSLASPFGYASLKHIDYVTFILAKSCKLLPVMALHIVLFQKRYPFYKYMVILCVTLGVALFTLHNPSTAKKAAKKGSGGEDASKVLGLFLLGVNLLFDGLTNTVQDNIFSRFRGFTGPQMMCAQNIISTALTVSYLLVSPYLASSPIGSWIGLSSSSSSSQNLSSGQGELLEAIKFITQYPAVGWDVLSFAICGAIGQVFIFHTLANFSSLLLVTITVTRKMLTIIVSVVFFGHAIKGMQWLGVGLVFGGVAGEAGFARWEKSKNAKAKAKAVAGTEGKKEL